MAGILDGIGDVIGTVFKWFTPEQILARAKDKIKRLKDERKKLLKGVCNPDTVKRIDRINSDIDKLQAYIDNH